DESGGPPEVNPLEVGRDAQVSLRGHPVELAGHVSGVNVGDVAHHQVDDLVDGFDGERLDLGHRRHALGRDEHFDLIVKTGRGVLPVVEGDEAAGGGGDDDGVTDFLDIHAAQAGFFAVDVDVHGRIIEGLVELDVAQAGD